MKDYSNPHNWKYCFIAEIRNADDQEERALFHNVVARDIADASNKAVRFAFAKHKGSYYVHCVRVSESDEHVIY